MCWSEAVGRARASVVDTSRSEVRSSGKAPSWLPHTRPDLCVPKTGRAASSERSRTTTTMPASHRPVTNVHDRAGPRDGDSVLGDRAARCGHRLRPRSRRAAKRPRLTGSGPRVWREHGPTWDTSRRRSTLWATGWPSPAGVVHLTLGLWPGRDDGHMSEGDEFVPTLEPKDLQMGCHGDQGCLGGA
jgi:hypothetical protein